MIKNTGNIKEDAVAWLLSFIFFKMLMSVPKDYTTALLMICATIPGAHLFVLVSKLILFFFW